MSYEKMKTVKLTGELMAFFFELGIKDIRIDIKLINGKSVISLQGEKPGIRSDILEKADRDLNTPREDQVEEYYWELLGESESAGELSLAGMLTDRADVSYTDNRLCITIYL